MGRPVIDLIGQQFGRLTVIARAPEKYLKGICWVCKCTCGIVKSVPSGRLRAPEGSRSCGCAGRELRGKLLGEFNTKHGMSRTRTYKIWSGMKKRCNNPQHKYFHRYGGRGITVCDEWLGADGFINFFADMGEAPEGLSIDRVNNNEGYSKSNCRWASRYDQLNNTSANQYFVHDGKALTVAEWSRETNIPYGTLRHRLVIKMVDRAGVDDALTLPVNFLHNRLKNF